MKGVLLLIVLLLFILSLREIFFSSNFSKKDKYYVLIYIGICIILIGFTGGRPLGIDRDSLMYSKYFETFCAYSYEQILIDNPHRVKEIGYLLLNKLFCDIGFREMLIFIALLSLLPKQYILYKYSSYPFLSLLVYISMFYLLRDFTQIRDAISISFVILALCLFYQNKIIVGGLLLCLGAMFHFIALLFIPIVIFMKYVKSIKYYYWFVILGVIFYLFNGIQYIKYIDFLPSQLSKYNELRGGGSFSIVVFGLLSVFLYFLIDEHSDKDKWLYKITLLAISMGFALYHHPVLFRMSSALVFFSILLYSNLLYKLESKEKSVSYILGIVLIGYFGMNSLSILVK